MLKTTAFLLCLSVQSAQAGFCQVHISRLNIDPKLLAPNASLHILDRGAAQVFNMDQSFSQVEIFLGIDGQKLEPRLRDGRVTLATLQKDCKADRPDCKTKILKTADYIGYAQSYSSGNFLQAKIRVLSGGDSIIVRATSAEPKETRKSIVQKAQAVFDAILPKLTRC